MPLRATAEYSRRDSPTRSTRRGFVAWQPHTRRAARLEPKRNGAAFQSRHVSVLCVVAGRLACRRRIALVALDPASRAARLGRGRLCRFRESPSLCEQRPPGMASGHRCSKRGVGTLVTARDPCVKAPAPTRNLKRTTDKLLRTKTQNGLCRRAVVGGLRETVFELVQSTPCAVRYFAA